MIKRISLCLAVICSLVFGLFLYLNRDLPYEIQPAKFNCLNEENGTFTTLKHHPSKIFGIGLSYANHINETASSYSTEAPPPVFRKSTNSISINGGLTPIPSYQSIGNRIDQLEEGLSEQLQQEDTALLPLLDYEVELAFVLLEDIDNRALSKADYIPKLGFLIANDLSARSIAILGEGKENRYDYWGASKSFDGFTPITSKVWIPNKHSVNGIPCLTLTTHLNDQIKQEEHTSNLIYTPVEMLRYILQRYPDGELKAGDLILTGTPGGVILSTPRWKVRLANLLGFDRLDKLRLLQKPENAMRFMKNGDRIRVSGEWLGEIDSTLSQ